MILAQHKFVGKLFWETDDVYFYFTHDKFPYNTQNKQKKKTATERINLTSTTEFEKEIVSALP